MMSKYILNQIIFLLLIGIGCQERSKNTIVVRANLEIPEGDFSAKPIEKILNIKKSSIKWEGTKMMRTRKHEGTINIKKGVLLFESDKLVGGYIISDMKSIKVTDMPAHEAVHIANLTNHLNSDFDTRSYPISKIEITNVEYITNTSVAVSGKLTIKDITKDIRVSATVVINTQMELAFESEFIFNRFDWNIGVDGSWLERQLVDDEIKIKIKLVTKLN